MHAAPVPSQMAPTTERQHIDLTDHPFHTIQVCSSAFLATLFPSCLNLKDCV